MDNPKGKVVYVCGTGGKTGYIFREAVRAAREGKSVFVTTTTHILREEGTITDGAEALKKLAPGKVLVAGSPDPVNDRKIVGFPEDVYRAVRDRADLTLVEADGARHAQIKVPYPHEPVIGEDASEIVVIYGARAAGLSIREAAYNPEGVSSVTGKGLDEILTESDVETAVRKGYVEVLQKRFPGVPVRPVKGAARTFHMILLAAGMSTRFGSNKLLYPIDGRPMYRIGADRLLEIVRKGALRSDLTVVTQYPEIVDGLKDTGADVVINPDPARGISSSLQCGLRHLIKETRLFGDDFIVVFAADQPYLRVETAENFMRALNKSSFRLGAVTDGTEMRNPCAFAAEYAGELLSLKGDAGGKRVLKARRDKVFLFPVKNEEELEDIDVL